MLELLEWAPEAGRSGITARREYFATVLGSIAGFAETGFWLEAGLPALLPPTLELLRLAAATAGEVGR